MQLHQTEQFKDWYSKAVRTQPSGSVQKDYSMLCWIVSFSGRITNMTDSFEKWRDTFLKHRNEVVVGEHDQVMFNSLFEKYNMKNAEDLGLGEITRPRMAQFVTDHAGSGEYQREFQNNWEKQTAL